MVELPEHVHRVKAKGKFYYYHHPGRRSKTPGQRTRIQHTPDEPEFWQVCAKLNNEKLPEKPDTYKGSFDELIDHYLASPKFGELKRSTQGTVRRYMVVISNTWGQLDVRKLKPKNAQRLHDSFSGTPEKARSIIAYLSGLYQWGISQGYAETNPCEYVIRFKKNTRGYRAWPRHMIDLFLDEAAPHLCDALIFALYTGQRQSDVLKMRWTDIDDGFISVVQDKTGKELEIKMHQSLVAWLGEIRSRKISHHEFILLNSRGKPWSNGFKASWSKQVKKIPAFKEANCVFHGLRRNSVNNLLEAGCTTAQVSSVTGQTMKMIEHYAQNINQKRLSDEAITKTEQKGN